MTWKFGINPLISTPSLSILKAKLGLQIKRARRYYANFREEIIRVASESWPSIETSPQHFVPSLLAATVALARLARAA